MANPFFNALGGGRMPGPLGDFMNLAQQFNQFKAGFRGDPQAAVQELLQSGKITQDQLNMAQSLAQQFQHLVQ